MTASAPAGYDDQNIFAKILRGEIPCHRVHEDADCLVFMDIMPEAEGHALVLPKAPSRNLLDADPAVLARIVGIVQRVARAAMTAFDADGVRIVQYNEAAAGQTVFHLHFHVIPASDAVAARGHAKVTAAPEVLAANAARLRTALEGAA